METAKHVHLTVNSARTLQFVVNASPPTNLTTLDNVLLLAHLEPMLIRVNALIVLVTVKSAKINKHVKHVTLVSTLTQPMDAVNVIQTVILVLDLVLVLFAHLDGMLTKVCVTPLALTKLMELMVNAKIVSVVACHVLDLANVINVKTPHISTI